MNECLILSKFHVLFVYDYELFYEQDYQVNSQERFFLSKQDIC